MKPNRKPSEPDQGHFLQPLGIALVCLIFILLFLIMGVMNLKALYKTLAGFMESRGMSIIEEVQASAEAYFQQSEQCQQSIFDADSGNLIGENSVSFQESFLVDLMNLAREIDLGHEAAPFSHTQLISLAERERLSLVAFSDENKQVILENRPVPREILRLANPVIQGDEDFRIRLFHRTEITEGLGFVACRRDSGRGAVILGLDDRGVRYLWSGFALRKAVETADRKPGTVYLMLTDPHGRIMAQSGDLPVNDNKLAPRFENGVSSRNIVSGEMEIAAPVHIFGEFAGVMRVGIKSDASDRMLKKDRRTIFVSIMFMVLITVFSLSVLYKNQNRYLKRMQAMERRIQQAERLSALGRLAAGVAHEVRNPLNAISMGIQRLQRDMPHQQITGVIRDEIRRLNQIIEEFLSISRTRRLTLKPHDLTGMLRQTSLLMAEEAESKGIQMILPPADVAFIVSMDMDKMKQAVLNLVKNAMESIPDTGKITLALKPRGREWVGVEISDTGTGLSEADITHIFDLDYTTKEKGLGFGLPFAHEIIRGHGGEIHVTSQVGVGTTFEIRLPLVNTLPIG